jgi:hypothetical protein
MSPDVIDDEARRRRPRRPVMKYMLMLRFPEGAGPQPGTAELDAEMTTWAAVNEELRASGAWITAGGLELDDAATTLRVRDGERVLTDGPYAEAKELLFSYYIIEVPDLDAAVGWAAKMPVAAYGSIEIRPMSAVEQAS